MRWFSRPEELPQIDTTNEAQCNDVDPYEFIASYEDRLSGSISTWQDISKEVHALTSPYQQQIHNAANGSGNGPVDITDNRISRLSADLKSYTWLLARAQSAGPLNIGNNLRRSQELRNAWNDMHDPVVNAFVSNKKFHYRQGSGVTAIADMMNRSDQASSVVVKEFANLFLDNADGLQDILDLYDNGIASQNRLFNELRRILATDWFQPNPQDSVLRQRLEELKASPLIFVPAFGRLAVSAEQNGKYKQIRNLARFAVIAGNKPINEQNMADTIVSTYANWHEIEGIRPLFDGYVNDELALIRSLIGRLIGTKDGYGIRIIPGMTEVQKLKNSLCFNNQPMQTRAEKRQNRRVSSKSDTLSLAALNDLEAATLPSEEVSPPRRSLRLAKQRPGNVDLVEVSIDQIPEIFKMNHDESLIADVKSMVSWLLDNPIGPASRILDEQRRVRIGNNNVLLRRFAPERAVGLKISNPNRHTRIIYALADTAIGILDVTTHADYNKTWANLT